jgi:hypothetical protein
MIDLVRDLVRHDLYQYLERCDTQTQLELGEWKEHLKNGVVCHTILGLLPIWGKLTSGQKRVAKELLHECQVLYPVRDTNFGPETNIVVPALWFLNRDRTSSPPTMERAIARRYGNTCVEPRMIWEYEFSANTVPESFFEGFVVKSYDYTLEQSVLPNSLEMWMADTSSLGLVTCTFSDASDADHHIIKIDAASKTPEGALEKLRYCISAIESLLHDYPGISTTPYFVELKPNDHRLRHVVNCNSLTARLHIHGYKVWLNSNLFCWYHKKPWEDSAKQSQYYETEKLLQSQNKVNERINTTLQHQNTRLQNYQDQITDINERFNNPII